MNHGLDNCDWCLRDALGREPPPPAPVVNIVAVGDDTRHFAPGMVAEMNGIAVRVMRVERTTLTIRPLWWIERLWLRLRGVMRCAWARATRWGRR